MTTASFEELTTSTPHKSLVVSSNSKAGRNNTGRITVRHRGGGHKRKYRLIDFRGTDKLNIPARIETIEYDPNRTCYIALVCFEDGERRYVLASQGMKVGESIVTAEKARVREGNRMLIKNVPEGYRVYNLEMTPGKGGQLIRTAGASGLIVSQEGEYTQVQLPSGEVRYIQKTCYATVGQLSNPDNSLIKIGKAGRNRWKGKRPEVRGKVMNPVDHPHGGGEGSNSIGMKYPKTPWGRPALGFKTRRRKKDSSMIVKRRSKKK